MKKQKLPTSYKTKIVLASSSATRVQMLRKHLDKFTIHSHRINEDEFKTQEDPEQIVATLAKNKALSIQHKFPNYFIIGADQILLCNKKIMSKPNTIKQAKENLMFLRNKNHTLLSSVFVHLDGKQFYSVTKKAVLYFNNISEGKIENYLQNNKKTVLESVGSYKIEENHEYKFIKIISGNKETIQGFPITELIKKLKAYE